ncbi:MAG TPA: hypothetical protein GXX55_06385 [Firmicutes bacterium]|nr:hypothetical protein [Bacillota bacterium]
MTVPWDELAQEVSALRKALVTRDLSALQRLLKTIPSLLAELESTMRNTAPAIPGAAEPGPAVAGEHTAANRWEDHLERIRADLAVCRRLAEDELAIVRGQLRLLSLAATPSLDLRA